jgi:hypothetical protein
MSSPTRNEKSSDLDPRRKSDKTPKRVWVSRWVILGLLMGWKTRNPGTATSTSRNTMYVVVERRNALFNGSKIFLLASWPILTMICIDVVVDEKDKRLLEAMEMYGKDWVKIAAHVGDGVTNRQVCA